MIENTAKRDFLKFTISFTADITPASWISGGFSVEKSIETGDDYQCQVSTGESVCVWYDIAYTGYTVEDWSTNTCTGGHKDAGPYVIWSPNENNSGGGFYCVTGDACRTQGEGYWG
ncbi:hypothetical protein GTA08_BOTSDO13672 [Neofusicoccum parvum]|nr:hypothetical protein GTA08_BOTSDO13672 [Neofusicoccum parvum]